MNKNAGFMRTLSYLIVKYRLVVCALFAALVVFSVFSVRWIKVENDITAYLSEETEARQGLTIMEEDFRTYGTAKVMVKNITAAQARSLQKALGEIPDVLLVQFDETEQHYKDACALFDLTFADVAKSERSEAALAAVTDYLKDYDTVCYSEVGYSLAALLAEQMGSVMIFVVIVVLAVLVFTSSTYAEIPVMLLTFLAAAAINMGTAFLMGTISFVSSSVSIVLQLALSVDYAIILCNRYKEERQTHEVREAAETALSASIPEIAASSLTTIAGLTAMTFMNFRLGADLGLNLIKAIVISLLTVFLLMPALLVYFGRAMDKTRHKNFVPRISFVGRFAYKTRFVMPILLVALAVGGYLFNSRVEFAYVQDLVPALRQTERYAALQEIQGQFGRNNLVAVLVPSGDYASEKALLDELSACPEVKSATGLSNIEIADGYALGDEVDAQTLASLAGVDMTTARALFAYYAAGTGAHQAALDDLDAFKAPLLDLFLYLHEAVETGKVELAPDQAALIGELFDSLRLVKGQLMSDAHSRIVLNLSLPPQSEETFAFLDKVHSMSARYYGTPAVLTGDSVSALDFRDSFASDNVTVSLLSILMVMVILFFTFRSFAMPLLLILVIQGSIWINFGIAALRGNYVFFMCYLIVSAIQTGANIDYAIVVSSRYREFRAGYGRQGAIIKTMNVAFPTIITSGLMMVCAGLLIGFSVSQCIISGMGLYVGVGTSISLLLILFALPQVLVLADRFILPATADTAGKRAAAAGFFARNRRSLAAALLSVAVVLAILAAPFGVLGARSDRDETERRTDELLSRTERLRTLALRVEDAKAQQSELAYGFAEQLMTDKIGSEKLAEGEAQYEEGLETYNEGKAQYDAGAAKLNNAVAAYNAGAARLEQGQAEYDAGLAQYNEGKAARDAAAAQLEQGQAQYDAGLAQYNEGKAARDAAAAQLAQGQAEYDAGLAKYNEGKAARDAAAAQLAQGQADYDAGLAKYNTAKARLDAVAPLYESALALQSRMNDLQAQYDAAVANGDDTQARALGIALAAARAAAEASNFESLLAQYQSAQAELSAGEAQLAEGKAKLDAGYAQLADADQQLADAESQLAAGKAKLDSGYAQLADADQQLANAESQLETGKAKLDSGYAQLSDADQQLADAESQLAAGKAKLDEGYGELHAGGAQIDSGRERLGSAAEQLKEGEAKLDEAAAELEAGRETLEQNRAELSESVSALDALNKQEAQLNEALEELRSDPELSDALRRSSGALETIDTAQATLRERVQSAQKQAELAFRLAIVLLCAAALALLALLLSVKWTQAPAVIAGIATLLAGVSFVLLRSRCADLAPWLLAGAALLAVACAIFVTTLLREKRTA